MSSTNSGPAQTVTPNLVPSNLATPQCTWANRPVTANLYDRIRITDFGTPGLLMVWDGSQWVPDGPQVLARSAVAVSVTGTTASTTLATISVPAGLLGLNGGITFSATWSLTSSANAKTIQTTLGGTLVTNLAGLTTVAGYSDWRRIRNRNSATSQVVGANIGGNPTGVTNAIATPTIDTTVAQPLLFVAQLTNAGETITLENYEVLVSA